jgi:PilZ domain
MGALSLLTSERREFNRSRCRVPATVRTPNVVHRAVKVFDICSGGVGIEIAGAGAEALVRLLGWSRLFSVSFDLPTGRVRARGRLTWSEKVTGDGSTTWRAGVQFTRLGAVGREAIRRQLQARSVQSMIDNYADLDAKNLRRVFTG